jgi:hypothetical protein
MLSSADVTLRCDATIQARRLLATIGVKPEGKQKTPAARSDRDFLNLIEPGSITRRRR